MAQISSNDVTMGDLLGKGKCGVYGGQCLGKPVAIKVLENVSVAQHNRFLEIAEAFSLKKIKHSHIVEIFGFSQTPNQALLIMEKTNGPIENSTISLSFQMKLKICRQACEALLVLQNEFQQGLKLRPLKKTDIQFTFDEGVPFAKVSLFGVSDTTLSVEETISANLKTFGVFLVGFLATGVDWEKYSLGQIGQKISEVISGCSSSNPKNQPTFVSLALIFEELQQQALNSMIESLIQHDSIAIDFWMRRIGYETVIKWKDFVKAICEENSLPETNKQIEYLKKAIYGNGLITSFQLSDFRMLLNFFGPFQKIFQNLSLIAAHQWFYGKITSPEADKILQAKPVGGFLVRYASPESGFDTGNWTIAYKTPNGQMIKHKITKNITPIFGSYSATFVLGTHPDKFSGIPEIINYLVSIGMIAKEQV